MLRARTSFAALSLGLFSSVFTSAQLIVSERETTGATLTHCGCR